jgi:hypothetical protein
MQENKLSGTIKGRIFWLAYILLASYEAVSSTQLLIISLVQVGKETIQPELSLQSATNIVQNAILAVSVRESVR